MDALDELSRLVAADSACSDDEEDVAEVLATSAPPSGRRDALPATFPTTHRGLEPPPGEASTTADRAAAAPSAADIDLVREMQDRARRARQEVEDVRRRLGVGQPVGAAGPPPIADEARVMEAAARQAAEAEERREQALEAERRRAERAVLDGLLAPTGTTAPAAPAAAAAAAATSASFDLGGADTHRVRVRINGREDRILRLRVDFGAPSDFIMQQLERELDACRRAIRLEFDGMPLALDETPESLDLEDDDLLDATVEEQDAITMYLDDPDGDLQFFFVRRGQTPACILKAVARARGAPAPSLYLVGEDGREVNPGRSFEAQDLRSGSRLTLRVR